MSVVRTPAMPGKVKSVFSISVVVLVVLLAITGKYGPLYYSSGEVEIAAAILSVGIVSCSGVILVKTISRVIWLISRGGGR